MEAHETDKFKRALVERRAELLLLSEISKDSRQAVELDQTSVGRVSRIDAIQNQAMAGAIDRNRAAELERITAALGRIESGDFGWCIVCGEDIARKRLELDPAIPTCIDCASGKRA